MKTPRAGFSLVEVLAMAAILIALVFVILPRSVGRPTKAPIIRCVNNLKNIGLAFRIFATDNGDRFPPELLLSNGIPLAKIDALRVYLELTNELSTPRLLYCPEDKKRRITESFSELSSKNLSYFASLTASENNPQSILAGDRNLQKDGVPVPPGLFALTVDTKISWSKEMHPEQGNVAMGDGSVQQFTSLRLPIGVRDQGIETNYLAIP